MRLAGWDRGDERTSDVPFPGGLPEGESAGRRPRMVCFYGTRVLHRTCTGPVEHGRQRPRHVAWPGL